MCPCPHQPRCPVASGNWAPPAAGGAVPGAGAAAGALASGGSEDRVCGQPARRAGGRGRREAGLLCAGEGRQQKVHPESPDSHVVPAAVAWPSRCPPALCLTPARPGPGRRTPCTLHSIRPCAAFLFLCGGRGQLFAGRGSESLSGSRFSALPASMSPSLPSAWALACEAVGLGPQLPSTESLTSHLSPT